MTIRPTPPICPCALLLMGALSLMMAGCASPRPGAAPVPDVVSVAAGVPDPLQRDVVLLSSTDFAVRSHAAERLVAAGEAALPALGAAGSGMVRVHDAEEVSTTRPVLRSILGDVTQERLYAHLGSTWPVVRCQAAEEIGRRGRWSAVPRLIERVHDEDVDVRAACASSLRRLTNRFFGFDAKARVSARRCAAGRWHEWWAVEGCVRAAEDERNGAG